MSDTIKEGLLRDNSNNIVYPKTKVSQVEGLSDYLVTANPTGATSASLTKLKIGNTNYVIDVGDHVQANKENTEITDSLKTLRINGTQYNFSIEGVEGLMEYLTQFNTMIEKAANAATPLEFICEHDGYDEETGCKVFVYADSLEDGQYESLLRGFYASLLFKGGIVGTIYMRPIMRKKNVYESSETFEFVTYTGTLVGADYTETFEAEVKIKDIALTVTPINPETGEPIEGTGGDNEIVGKSIEIEITQVETPTTYDNAEDASF